MEMQAKAMYDALILDVDGTLWDATETFAKAYSDASSELASDFGISPHYFTAAEIRPELGKPTEIIFRNLYPELASRLPDPKADAAILALMNASIEREYEYIGTLGGRLYDGLAESVRILSERLPLYIVSNCEKGYIESFLNFAGIRGCFSGWLCYGDTRREKNDTLLQLAEQYQIRHGVYVGDTLHDAKCTHLAGMDFIWASYGFGNVPEDMADYTIERFSDLLDIIS